MLVCRSVYLSVSLFIYLPSCLSVYLPVCLPGYVCLSVSLQTHHVVSTWNPRGVCRVSVSVSVYQSPCLYVYSSNVSTLMG